MRFARVVLGFLLLSIAGGAQQYVISTVAGGGLPPTPAAGIDVPISPGPTATDAMGNLYFSSDGFYAVFKLDRSGVMTRVAGNGRPGYSGDGGPATSAQLDYGSFALAVDRAGNVFIAGAHRIRRVSPEGVISTVAGNGRQGYSGDGGSAASAALDFPAALAVDGAGNLFIADSENHRIRKVAISGIITTVAGDGTIGRSGDGGPATGAQLGQTRGLAVDDTGNLFISDNVTQSIRKVSRDGIITTVAGGGIAGGSGVAVDGLGNLFIIAGDARILKLARDGTISTVAGNGSRGFSGDGGPATSAQLNSPFGLAVDAKGNLFIGGYFRVRKVSPGGTITTVAGNGTQGFSGDGGPATDAQLRNATGVAVDGAGNLFIADGSTLSPLAGKNRIRKVSPSGIITTVAGGGTLLGAAGDGGLATSAQLGEMRGLAVDGAGNLFVAEGSNMAVNGNFFFSENRIRKVSPDGIITTVAGNGAPSGFSGDGGPATSAQLSQLRGVVVDAAGNLFIADQGNGRIRKVSPDGIITTVAGNGNFGFSGDHGPATDAALWYIGGVAVDSEGNLFITTSDYDAGGGYVRKVSPDGIITSVAGTGAYGFSGDGGPATSAQLDELGGVVVDAAGNVYIADDTVVRILRPLDRSAWIGSVVDAASQSPNPISPGKVVVIYGVGLGPAQLVQNQPSNGQFGTAASGTVVSFNGIAGPVLYASATQVAAVVPYALSGATAQVTVAYQSQVSAAFPVFVAPAAPSLFTLNQTGAGQAAATNADGTVNTAVNPVKIGGYISLYATGEGQTSPVGVDGKLGGSSPSLPVKVTVGGVPAAVRYSGGAPGLVAGLMQVNVEIPNGVQPGGYVPVVLQVGDASTTSGAVWIAVSGN